MRAVCAKCIILGHKNFGEYHKLVFLYNEDLGKIKAIAKGARKITSKFTGHLETLSIAKCGLYFGPKNIILTEIETISRPHKNQSLTLTSALFQIAEITNEIIYENQSLDALGPLIEGALNHIGKSPKPELISIAYIVKLLDKSGLMPNLKETKTSLKEKYIKCLHYLQLETFPNIEKITLSPEEKFELQKILKTLIERETGKTFSSFYS